MRNVRDLSDTTSTVPPALLSASQGFVWKLCGLYEPLNDDLAAIYASELDPSTEAVWALPEMAARRTT